jgi:hypothetical protein
MMRRTIGQLPPRLAARRPAIVPALCALLIAACSSGEGSGDLTAPPARDTSAVPGASAPPASASAASAAPAASSAAPLPAAVPPSERPSARAVRPTGANAVRWQRIFDTYGHLLDMEYILADYHRRHPEKTELVPLGTTHQGRPIQALLIADRPAAARHRPAVLLNGAHHGDEPLSSAIVLDAIDTLLADPPDPRVSRHLSELAVWCVPMVNPDGFAQFMVDFGAGRKNGRETRSPKSRTPMNARGVDLNRNYPFRWGAHGEGGSSKDPNRRSYRGPAPTSEPEAAAMVGLSDREHFVASISYHVGTVALLAPYTIDGVPQPSPNEAWLVAQDVAAKMGKINDRPVYVRKNLYTVDGTDQDYHRFAHGTLALLLESANRSWETPDLMKNGVAAIRPSWLALFDRYLDGPSVEGRVRDEAGRPVSARVDVAELRTRAGEKWQSRCSDGFYGRFLPAFGKFTVRVTPPAGGPPIEKTVEVERGKGRASADIVVPGTGPTGCDPAVK